MLSVQMSFHWTSKEIGQNSSLVLGNTLYQNILNWLAIYLQGSRALQSKQIIESDMYFDHELSIAVKVNGSPG